MQERLERTPNRKGPEYLGHERELIREDWAYINSELKLAKRERTKIKNYAQKVISGEFPPNSDHHRQYLGQRHWHTIREALYKKNEKLNPQYRFLERYSQVEQSNNFTLNDHLAQLGNNIDLVWGRLYWSITSREWKISTDLARSLSNGKIKIIKNWNVEAADEDLVRRTWLLGKDVENTHQTSPRILNIKLDEAIEKDITKVSRRIRERPPDITLKRLGSALGKLEKEI